MSEILEKINKTHTVIATVVLNCRVVGEINDEIIEDHTNDNGKTII